MGLRAGTENVLEIVGLGKACQLAAERLAGDGLHLQAMRDRLEQGLLAALPDIRINGHRHHRLPNTCSVSFLGLEANRILEEIGLEVAASAGAACHSDHVQISHVLEAMRVPPEWAKGTLRFTTGRMTTAGDIDRALQVIIRAIGQLKA
jgi:cysteine desulfurase